MKMTMWTYEECKAEEAYIFTVNPTALGQPFNRDRECFARYCRMQADHIERSGWRPVAANIRKLING